MNQEIDIEKLFSAKFDHFEVKSSEEDWLKLSSKLSVSNFLKFSLITFNIYFLFGLLTIAGVATYSGLKYYRLIKKVHQLEQTIEDFKKLEPIQNAPFVAPIDTNQASVTKTNNSTEERTIRAEVQGKNAKTEEIVTNANPVQIIRDTAQVINALPLQSDTTNKNKIKKVKKTVTIKKDKVVIKDTVVITKSLK
jgi:hypothetical protein